MTDKITTQELRARAAVLGFVLEVDLVSHELYLSREGDPDVWKGNEDKVLGFLLGYATAAIDYSGRS